jgi:hypothetical protein
LAIGEKKKRSLMKSLREQQNMSVWPFGFSPIANCQLPIALSPFSLAHYE